MFQSKIFSYKFNSFHDEERREGALGFKITDIQEERAEEEADSPKMETRRKFGVAVPNSKARKDGFVKSGGVNSGMRTDEKTNPTAPLERQDSELSTLSSFSEVDLDEFYVEESPPGTADDEDRFPLKESFPFAFIVQATNSTKVSIEFN